MAHIRNQPPVFVPEDFWWDEMDHVSKAAIMDIVWDMATVLAGKEGDPTAIIPVIRKHRDVVLVHRKQAKKGA